MSEEYIPLGKWLKKQRQHRQDGAIRPDRENKLQALVDMGGGKCEDQFILFVEQSCSVMIYLKAYNL